MMFAIIYAYSNTPYVLLLTEAQVQEDTILAPIVLTLIHLGKYETRYFKANDTTYLIVRLD